MIIDNNSLNDLGKRAKQMAQDKKITIEEIPVLLDGGTVNAVDFKRLQAAINSLEKAFSQNCCQACQSQCNQCIQCSQCSQCRNCVCNCHHSNCGCGQA